MDSIKGQGFFIPSALNQKSKATFLTHQLTIFGAKGSKYATRSLIAGVAAMFSAHQLLKQQKLASADNQKRPTVFGWGSCNQGQLGIGKVNQGITVPTIISDLEGM